jgi:hypothetical protein
MSSEEVNSDDEDMPKLNVLDPFTIIVIILVIVVILGIPHHFDTIYKGVTTFINFNETFAAVYNFTCPLA